MADEDDLPPVAREPSDDSTLGGSLGTVFGWTAMLGFVFAIVGLVAYLIMRWL